ncbi:MAG: hypothetical protein OEM41_08820, partial [Ignavibacteria bacterium]|nr:hypothetical protein [Ignavibacteria bacterium]
VTEFGQDLGFNPGIGFGAALRFRPDSDLSLSLSGLITNTDVDFSLITETGHLPVTVSVIRLQLEYRLLAWFVDLHGSLSAGLLRMDTEEYRVSLGALGSQVIPSRQESFASAAAGLVFSRTVASNIDVRIEPQMSFYSRNSNTFSFISIAGGLSIGIL